jgi:hypothetical protein
MEPSNHAVADSTGLCVAEVTGQAPVRNLGATEPATCELDVKFPSGSARLFSNDRMLLKKGVWFRWMGVSLGLDGRENIAV